MILLLAILLGLLAGMIRAESGKLPYQVVRLKAAWLVIPAFLSQLAIAELHHVSIQVDDQVAAYSLMLGQACLLSFTLFNLKKPGFYLLALGTTLNFIVMFVNQGFMPITPATVGELYPNVSGNTWSMGHHLWNSKNIVLDENLTHLAFLSDRFTVPEWSPYRVAFSLGDVILAAGAFWLFWSLGGASKNIEESNYGNTKTMPRKIRTNRRKSRGEGTESNSDGSGH